VSVGEAFTLHIANVGTNRSVEASPPNLLLQVCHVSTDSLSAVYCGLEKIGKLKK
jgi:hypothetical protein